MAGGRPTKYKAEFADQAEKICKLGATDEQLAEFFEVAVTTIDNWKRDHKEFLGAIKRGKTLADAEVADKLYHRATGYEHPEVDIRVIDSQIVMTNLVKHYPPDTAAAIFWLKNRRKKEWRDKQDVDLTSSDGSMTPTRIELVARDVDSDDSATS